MASREAVFAHADDVKRDFGAAHFVFNNAGATVVGTFEHLDIDEIEWQLGINLWGVIYGSKAFLPLMLAQREGCIVNVSSVFGLIGFPAQSARCPIRRLKDWLRTTSSRLLPCFSLYKRAKMVGELGALRAGG